MDITAGGAQHYASARIWLQVIQIETYRCQLTVKETLTFAVSCVEYFCSSCQKLCSEVLSIVNKNTKFIQNPNHCCTRKMHGLSKLIHSI